MSLLTGVRTVLSWHLDLQLLPARLDLGLPARSQAEAMSWLGRPDGRTQALREQWLAVSRVVTVLRCLPAAPTGASGRWTGASGAPMAAGPLPVALS